MSQDPYRSRPGTRAMETPLPPREAVLITMGSPCSRANAATSATSDTGVVIAWLAAEFRNVQAGTCRREPRQGPGASGA